MDRLDRPEEGKRGSGVARPADPAGATPFLPPLTGGFAPTPASVLFAPAEGLAPAGRAILAPPEGLPAGNGAPRFLRAAADGWAWAGAPIAGRAAASCSP